MRPVRANGSFRSSTFHAGIVGSDHLGLKQDVLRCLIQRIEQFGHRWQPTTHRLTRDLHALSLEDLLLPVQRLMIGNLLTITCASMLAPARAVRRQDDRTAAQMNWLQLVMPLACFSV